jgi:multidrug resistance efflux pump
VIVFLTLIYVAILALLIKVKVLKPTKLAKASPLIWMAFLLVFLFVPMQFYAPAGVARVFRYSVAIVPNVAGVVSEVYVQPNVPLEAGDVLFQIEDTPYRAAVDQTQAQLSLARLRLEQAKELLRTDAGTRFEVEQYAAQVEQLSAALVAAKWNLAETTVRAPKAGFVTNVGLRRGARVVNMPFSPAMAFYERKAVFAAQIAEAYVRHLEVGQEVEATFKMLPGEVFKAKISQILPANSLGTVPPSGAAPAPRSISPTAFFVRLELDDPQLLERVPAGAMASVAVYTTKGKATHLIRRVMLRMDAWMNYVSPF